MQKIKPVLALTLAILMAAPPGFASSHREAPIVALDQKADITDLFAFVSYDNPDRVTFILNVDPFLDPSNGPNYFPFDPNILYEIKIDNNNDAQADVRLQFQFETEIRLPEIFTGFIGAGTGIVAPVNSPPPGAPGTPLIPPAITALDGPGSEGLSLRQKYTVQIHRRNMRPMMLDGGGKLFAVPSNVGPRTMPDYVALAEKGIYDLSDGVRVFAGTVDDPFYIDVGAAFDTLNFHLNPPVLTAAQDADGQTNFAADDLSGFNVNTIAIEVPIELLTVDGQKHPATDPKATIGVWATTSRRQITIRRREGIPGTLQTTGNFMQVQRMANPLINELLIGTGYKDRWSTEPPSRDAQFANFALDPLLARAVQAAFGIDIPAPPRTDLLPLVTYAPPIAAPGTKAGPIADLLRLNTGVPPTPATQRNRLGALAGDSGGFPNGRRVSDDVTDIALRVVAGGVLNAKFNKAPNNRLGDGVNTNDKPFQETFPYVAYAHSGRDRRHIDPGETGCGSGGATVCPGP